MSDWRNTDSPLTNRKLRSLDLSKIRFPTDRVSVEQLRTRDAASFDTPYGDEIQQSASLQGLTTVMGLERELAIIAFCERAGIPGHDVRIDMKERGDVVRLLFDEYERLGITAGKVESRQWIQSIEAQARIQARTASRGRG